MRRLAVLMAALALAGCVVGPDYAPPRVELPPRFSNGAPNAPQLDRWWRRFNDPLLDSLVAEALASNLDLAAASARVAQARAVRSASGAARLPQVDAAASAARARDVTPGPDGAFRAATTDVGQTGLQASWEIDLFGRIARTVEGADANLAATQADRDALRLALASEVARTYLSLRGYERRAELQRQGFRSQLETAALTRRLFDAGEIGAVDRERAEALAANTFAAIPALEAERAAAAHRLAILTGRPPAALAERLAAPGAVRTPDQDLSAGLPADLVRRRPDVRAAERRLAAAYAEIGIATADLYPRLTLTGSVGSLAGRTRGEDFATSRIWSLGAGLLGPLFDGGRRRAIVRLREAERDESLARYRQSVLTGLEDVETALVRYERERARRERLSQALDRYARADDIVRRAWRAGEISFLDVLDTDRSLVAARDALAASEVEVDLAMVRVFAALGGGWPEASALIS